MDFLRSFAVLLVVMRHLMSVFGFEGTRWIQPQAIGIFGVLLFFVHTSLVLMFSMERQQQRLGFRHFYMTFLVRRVFRIYPLAVTVVLALTVCTLLIPGTAGLAARLSGWGLASNLLLVQDFARQPNITGVLWSLPLEMQMYLFLPLLFLNAENSVSEGCYGYGAAGCCLGCFTPSIRDCRDCLSMCPAFCRASCATSSLAKSQLCLSGCFRFCWRRCWLRTRQPTACSIMGRLFLGCRLA